MSQRLRTREELATLVEQSFTETPDYIADALSDTLHLTSDWHNTDNRAEAQDIINELKSLSNTIVEACAAETA